MIIGLAHYLIVAALLFTIGVFGSGFVDGLVSRPSHAANCAGVSAMTTIGTSGWRSKRMA